MKVIDLSGTYKVFSEDGSIDTKINLPGSSCEAHIGTKQEYFSEYVKETVRAPRERYEYIGQLFYEKEFEIPEGSENCEISMLFERVNIASKLWIDGVQIGRGVIGLSTPHVYRLSDRVFNDGESILRLTPGKHTLKLMVDNRDLLHMGDMASGYSVDTQGYWNGVVGRMELIIKPIDNIESVQVFPDSEVIKLHTVLHTDRHEPMKVKYGELTFELFDAEGNALARSTEKVELFSARQRVRSELKFCFGVNDLWSEFAGRLFTLTAILDCDGVKDEYVTEFGVRNIYVRNRQFNINGRPLSLRGTINCAQYPLTGYPPMDVKTWEEHFKAYKECGLNHVRFHAWCPPEAAFIAADRLGLYLSIEMPLWLNRDVVPWELGDDEWHRLYYRDEALRLSEWYGNHPSFCFFANGNENMGDFALMETIIEETKAIDNRRLYTMTSNFDHPLSAAEDYQSAFEICHMRVRNQTRQEEVANGTFTDYAEVCAVSRVPFLSFEVGQYCVYPDVDICEDYCGNMMPVNFDIIRKMMQEKGVYDKLQDYIRYSGMLAFRLYKEDIEAVLRTKGMGGFQLLSLIDYTGQSTATVGMLDILHRDKNFFDRTEWSKFCCEVVPLFAAKRIFKNTENLDATISLYNYGEKKVAKPDFRVVFKSGGKTLKDITFKRVEGSLKLNMPLDFIRENTLINVFVSTKIGGRIYENSWRIFVYADCEAEKVNVPMADTPDKLEELVKNNSFIIATADAFCSEELSKNAFIPVFWSPVHFKSDRPVGAMIKANHPALSDFPTDEYLDYQWKELMDNSRSLKYGDRVVSPVVEMVPNFVDNVAKGPLCEFEYKGCRVLFCGFDLTREDLPTVALRNSLIKYVSNNQ